MSLIGHSVIIKECAMGLLTHFLMIRGRPLGAQRGGADDPEVPYESVDGRFYDRFSRCEHGVNRGLHKLLLPIRISGRADCDLSVRRYRACCVVAADL